MLKKKNADNFFASKPSEVTTKINKFNINFRNKLRNKNNKMPNAKNKMPPFNMKLTRVYLKISKKLNY